MVPIYKSGLVVVGQQIDIFIDRSKIFFRKFYMDVNLSEIYKKKINWTIFFDEKFFEKIHKTKNWNFQIFGHSI
jgi:hypothetical protein